MKKLLPILLAAVSLDAAALPGYLTNSAVNYVAGITTWSEDVKSILIRDIRADHDRQVEAYAEAQALRAELASLVAIEERFEELRLSRVQVSIRMQDAISPLLAREASLQRLVDTRPAGSPVWDRPDWQAWNTARIRGMNIHGYGANVYAELDAVQVQYNATRASFDAELELIDAELDELRGQRDTARIREIEQTLTPLNEEVQYLYDKYWYQTPDGMWGVSFRYWL